jgi:hypothetical protein
MSAAHFSATSSLTERVGAAGIIEVSKTRNLLGRIEDELDLPSTSKRRETPPDLLYRNFEDMAVYSRFGRSLKMQARTAVAPLKYEAIKDKETQDTWRVEAIESASGDVFVATFSGPMAEERALEYADFKNHSA